MSCLSHPLDFIFYIDNVLATVSYMDCSDVFFFLAIRGKEMTYGENSSPSSFLESLSRTLVC